MSKPMGALLMLATSWWACISRRSNTAAAEKQSKVLVNETAIWACTQHNTHTCPDNWRLALSVSFTITIQQPFYRRNMTAMNNLFEFNLSLKVQELRATFHSVPEKNREGDIDC